MCDMLAMGAMQLILRFIKRAYDDPNDLEARGAMIKASMIAGVAFSQTRTTGIHALSFPLTTEYHASHGTACAGKGRRKSCRRCPPTWVMRMRARSRTRSRR